jgi:hypothetical protein
MDVKHQYLGKREVGKDGSGKRSWLLLISIENCTEIERFLLKTVKFL